MTTKIIGVVILILTLSGCVTNAERQTQQELAAIDDDKCRWYGVKPDDLAYVACRTRINTARTGRSCFGSCH